MTTPTFFDSETVYPYPSGDSDIIDKFGIPLYDMTTCPVCNVNGKFIQIIAHLNNIAGETGNLFDLKFGCHGWTFKQIGLWLKEKGY